MVEQLLILLVVIQIHSLDLMFLTLTLMKWIFVMSFIDMLILLIIQTLKIAL